MFKHTKFSQKLVWGRGFLVEFGSVFITTPPPLVAGSRFNDTI